MKKFIFAIAAIAAMTMTSCCSSATTEEEVNDSTVVTADSVCECGDSIIVDSLN